MSRRKKPNKLAQAIAEFERLRARSEELQLKNAPGKILMRYMREINALYCKIERMRLINQ